MNKAMLKKDDRIRQSIRLDRHLWDGIDSARFERPGSVSRNTWIIEAVMEKLQREAANAPTRETGDA